MQKKFNISVKQLYLLIFITAASLTGLGLYGINGYKKLNDNTRTLYADRVVCMRQLANMRFQYAGEILPAALNVKNHLLTFDAAQQRIRKAGLIIDSNWRSYKLTYLTPEETFLARQTDTLKNQVDKDTKILESILLEKDTAALNDLIIKQSLAVQAPFSIKLTQLMDLQERVGHQIFESSSHVYATASNNFALWIFFSLLLALPLSFYIIKNIKRLIRDILTSNDIIVSSEQKYRSILENASDAIYIADNTGNFLDLSKSMCKMLGYSKEELMRLNFSEIIDPENLKTDPVERPVIPNQPIFKERTFITRDGEKVEVEITGQRLDDDRLMGAARDITERKRMEIELRDAELKFRTVAEKSMLGVYITQNKRFLYVNPRFAEIFGYTCKELLDLSTGIIDTIYAEESRAMIREKIRARDNGETEGAHYEAIGLKKDGTRTHVEFYGNRVTINGQPAAIGTTLDITERKQAEERIVKEKELSNTIINSLPGIFYLQSTSGEYLLWNKNFETVTGYTREEIVKLKTEGLIVEEDLERVIDTIKKLFTEGYAIVEATAKMKDGTRIPFLLTGIPIMYQDQLCLLGTGIDISSRVKAEEELKISEQNLELYNRELNLLNTINNIILRYKDELELYTEVCNCIVRSGGYKLAWICYKPDENDADQIVKPLVAFGATNYLSGVKIDLNDPEQANGPTGTTLQTRDTSVNNDANNAGFFLPWAERAKEHGIQSSLSLYLDLGNGKIGALVIYSPRTNAFDQHEVYVLERLASNVSIAVQGIRIEIELSQSEARFRGAFENASIGVGLISLKGQWLKVNRALCEMLGYNEEEFLKLSFQQLTHLDDLGSDLEFLEQTLSGKKEYYKVEKRYVHKDGSIVWVSLNVSLIRDQNKQPMYFVSQIENITEKVESQLKFQNLVENFIVGVYILQNGRLVYVNPRLIEETGYSEEEIIGMPYDQFIYEDDREFVMEIIDSREKRLIDTVRYEARVIKKDGQPLWYEILGSTTTYMGATALIGTMVNVSERKAVYDELKKSEANLRSIFDSTDVSYLLLDTKYNIISLNQQMRDVYRDNVGITLMEGDSLIELIIPERRQNDRKLYDDVVRTKNPSGYEASFINNGTARHFAASVIPIIVADEVIGLCISSVDITERKNALEKLKAANEDLQKKTKELEYSNTELEQFAYVASHDLQEPLRMVASFLTQLERKYSDVLDEKGKKYIYFATDGAKRMRQLILDLLEFSRVGRTEDSLEEVDFNDLMNEVLPLYRKSIEELKAKVYFEQLPTMQVYKTPVRQVFQNLLSNALKYHREGVAPLVVISSKETSAAYVFSVKDNGIGIDPEYFNQIFIIFKRLHNRDQYPGTGMGLAITKKIVENMGGRIWVESRESEGSVFHFTISKHTNR